ncbi:MAG: hypothetical protein ACR2FU_18525 [Streptosporangiaceae bacterium]
MYSRQLEQIASQRPAELRATRAAAARPAPAAAGPPRKPIRTQTGWALVSIGLRLAASGHR